MKLIHRVCLIPAWILITTIAHAQESRSTSEKPVDENEPTYGIRINQRVLNGFLDQFVQRMERQYDLSPDQIKELQSVFRERVPGFLRTNQKEFEVLANDFLDTLNQNDAPTPERVAAWAKRALPMLDKLHEFTGQTVEAMKDHLADDQVVKLDATMAGLDVGLQLVTKRLNNWADGNYDPVTEWHRNPEAQKRDREREREAQRAMEEARLATLREYGMEAEAGRKLAAGPAAAATPNDVGNKSETNAAKRTQPKDEWDRYVEAFIARYVLNDTQRQKALVLLSQARDQKEKHLSSKNAEIEKLGERFAELKRQQDKEGLAAAETRYNDLMKPVELAFDKLKEKLETIPTRDQRAKAAERELKKDAPPTAEAGGERAQRP